MLTLSKIGKIHAITSLLYDFNVIQLDAIHDALFKMRQKGEFRSGLQGTDTKIIAGN